MGNQAPQPLEKKLSKSKSALSMKSIKNEDILDFVNEITTMACLSSTNTSSNYDLIFKKMGFKEKATPIPKCTKITRHGQPIFVCYECSLQDTAYLCQQCFEKGNHDRHRFNVFLNNNNWGTIYCRCGDEQFMKKQTICETHKKAPKMMIPSVDKKQLKKFTDYFNEIFKILFNLNKKGRHHAFQKSMINFLAKITHENLMYTRILSEFLLAKSCINPEKTNLQMLFKINRMTGSTQLNIIRNLNLIPQYKISFMKELVEEAQSKEFVELLFNFAGGAANLIELAKSQDAIKKNSHYLQAIINDGSDATEIWKCYIRNGLTQNDLRSSPNIMTAILKSLKNDEKYIFLMLEQLLDHDISISKEYILVCLMILEPTMFLGAQKKGKLKNLEKLQSKFYEYYSKIFDNMNIYGQNQSLHYQFFVLLPYFSFGENLVSKFWNEVALRFEIVSDRKQKNIIKEASNVYFNIITNFISQFMRWDNFVLAKASRYELEEYPKNSKLLEKVLGQIFDNRPKTQRHEMLAIIDEYTQNQRDLAKKFIEKNLRYKAKRQKYYNISKKMLNNPYNYQQLSVGCPFKFTTWQENVHKKIFNNTFYDLVPKLIKFAQKAHMEDVGTVQTVAVISANLSLINRQMKNTLKEITRNFVKQIPDVKQNVYYTIAGIRDRLELDIDDLQQKEKTGSKKVKLDLMTEIRDKKFMQMKQKQERIRKRWLQYTERVSDDEEQDLFDEEICHFCKEKQNETKRFVYPCKFTRNTVVSSLLKSEVTDLDINICLHKVHEECFEKNRRKNQCLICKFEFNCYLPERALANESYTKNWMRAFENIVTSINLEQGKSFNSDWATIFLTYLVYSKSFKVLLKSSELQEKQRRVADEIILSHYRSQLENWPDLTKQTMKKAEKTVKGQVTRESNTKKVVKSLVLELVVQQITDVPFKNNKRIYKKIRQMINMIGTENASKINEEFPWSRDNEDVQEIYQTNIAEQIGYLFKISDIPDNAVSFLKEVSIKCPMCGKYQPSSWQCLFCKRKSCSNCMNQRYHCERDHRGSGIILKDIDGNYELYHDNRMITSGSIYRNEYSEGWQRNIKPEGWNANTDEIFEFYNKILHSINPEVRKNNWNYDTNSDDESRGGVRNQEDEERDENENSYNEDEELEVEQEQDFEDEDDS